MKIKKNIIGSGFLANYFKKYTKLINKLNICIYAAGVSNSLCEKELSRVEIFIKWCKLICLFSVGFHLA